MKRKQKKKAFKKRWSQKPPKASKSLAVLPSDPHPAELHNLDQHGDVTLHVVYESTSTDILVCSRTLARSSPYFDTLLYGNFGESCAKHRLSAWIVRMEEINPEGLLPVLQFLHACKAPCLKGMTAREIFEIASVIDYLRCQAPFQEFLPHWEKTIRKEAGYRFEIADKCCLELPYAAAYLGLECTFRETLALLLRTVSNRRPPLPGSPGGHSVSYKQQHKPLVVVEEDEHLSGMSEEQDPLDIVKQLNNKLDQAVIDDKKDKAYAYSMFKDTLTPYCLSNDSFLNKYPHADSLKAFGRHWRSFLDETKQSLHSFHPDVLRRESALIYTTDLLNILNHVVELFPGGFHNDDNIVLELVRELSAVQSELDAVSRTSSMHTLSPVTMGFIADRRERFEA
ncbi:BTB/POZ domain-containing protein [Microdochium nivale]|nr:BTB/POZ domain-containing protein [Microdochium nivale]